MNFRSLFPLLAIVSLSSFAGFGCNDETTNPGETTNPDIEKIAYESARENDPCDSDTYNSKCINEREYTYCSYDAIEVCACGDGTENDVCVLFDGTTEAACATKEFDFAFTFEGEGNGLCQTEGEIKTFAMKET